MSRPALRAAIEPPPCDEKAAVTRIVLRRTGARPLCFTGALVQALESDGGLGQNLIRLALYRCGDGFAVSLSHEPVCAGTPALAWHRAELCPTLEQALAVFETAQPPGDDGGAAPCGAAEAILMRAAEGVAREAALLHAFRNAVGNFLLKLCLLNVPSIL